MADCGVAIFSTNLSGLTTEVTFFPETGGTVNLGTQVFPFSYVADYFYGTYNCYVPTYAYTYTIVVAGPTPTPTTTPTVTPTITSTPTASPVYYYYLLLNCDLATNALGRSSVPLTGETFNVDVDTCYSIVGYGVDTSYDYDLDLAVLVTDCTDALCTDVTLTPTPTNTETPTNTPSETPTNTPTETPTPTNTETPTNTPSETPTETPTPTNTETPTETPTPTNTETPTNTPTVTPTRSYFSFSITSGATSNEACNTGTIGTIWGNNFQFDNCTNFFVDDLGNTGLSAGYYSNGPLVVELDSTGAETGGYSLC